MIYIPIKIKEFIKDKKGNKFVICDGIMNTIPLTEFRNIKKIKLDILKIKRKSFNLKSIRKGQIFTLLFKDGNYERCKNKNINKWGEYVFIKYEKYINNEYNKKLKKKKFKQNKKQSFFDNFFNFNLDLVNLKIN